MDLNAECTQWAVKFSGKHGLYSKSKLQIEVHFPALYICSVCGRNSVGRVSASQAECREFEPRRPLI